MGTAAAAFAPHVEGTVGHRAGGERAFQLAQPCHQLGVGAREEIVECRWRRGAEIERQLTKHSSKSRKWELPGANALMVNSCKACSTDSLAAIRAGLPRGSR